MKVRPETRGRKRSPFNEMLTESVRTWHIEHERLGSKQEKRGVVSAGPFPDPQTAANCYRNSTGFRQLSKDYNRVFGISTNGKYINVFYKGE